MAKAVMFTLISLAITICLFLFEGQIVGFITGFVYDISNRELGMAVMDPAEIQMFMDLFTGLKYIAAASTILGIISIIFGHRKKKEKK